MKKIKPLRVGSPPGVSSYILAYTLQFLCGVSPGSARQRSPRNPRGGTAYHMRAFVPVSFYNSIYCSGKTNPYCNRIQRYNNTNPDFI